MRTRTYSELIRLETLEERYAYLSLQGTVGRATFGAERYVNQNFYTSKQWRDIRHEVIARDEGLDLGVEGFEINERPTIHHMNPMTILDLVHEDPDILDPEYLITVSHRTHNAIHYGNESHLPRVFVPRSPGDTKLRRR